MISSMAELGPPKGRIPNFLTPQGAEDLEKFGLNERFQDEWLRLQSEKQQGQQIRGRSGMTMSPSLYFASRRCTHSDVMSVVTTSRVSKPSGKDPFKKPKLGASQPPFSDPRYTSPLCDAAALDQDDHLRKNRALWDEHNKFMSRLQEKRRIRHALEFRGAQAMQTLFRSYRWRKIMRTTVETLIDETRMEKSFAAIQSDMDELAAAKQAKTDAQLRRVRAVVRAQCAWRRHMVERSVRKERALRETEDSSMAASRIQRVARGRKSRAQIRGKRLALREEAELRASTNIQSAFRSRVARNKVYHTRLRLRMCAVLWIQTWARKILARRAKTRHAAHKAHTTQFGGATQLQRLARGRTGRDKARRQSNFLENELKDAGALSIQRVARGMLGKRRFAAILLAKQQARTLRATLDLQRTARGYLGRESFKVTKEIQLEDIFLQAKLGNAQQVEDLYQGLCTDEEYTETSTDNKGDTVLTVAAAHGHLVIVRKALKWGSDINHTNIAGATALSQAVHGKFADMAEYLLTKGADFNIAVGRPLLVACAANGLHQPMLAMLAQGADVDITDDTPNGLGRAALHEACRFGDLAPVQALLDAEADIDWQDQGGATALHLAAGFANGGYPKVVDLLLTEGCDCMLDDTTEMTAWRRAVEADNEECAKILRRAAGIGHPGAKTRPNKPKKPKKAAVEVPDGGSGSGSGSGGGGGSGSGKATVEVPDESVPAADEDVDFAALEADMVDSDEGGADAEVDLNDATEVLDTFRMNNVAQATSLLERGLSVDFQGDGGESVLMAAADSVAEDAARLLLEGGCQTSIADEEGRTALHHAAAHDAMCGMLLDKGADPTQPDSKGDSPLHLSADHDSSLIVGGAMGKAVEADKLDLNVGDGDGRTALMRAARCGNKRVVLFILKQGADVGVQDKVGDNALHMAAEGGNAAIVDMLLEHGDVDDILNRANKEGEVPFQRAAKFGRASSLAAMVNAGAKALVDESVPPFRLNRTCLHEVATSNSNSSDAVNVLVALGYSVGTKDSDGAFPVHLAAVAGDAECVRVLLELSGGVSNPGGANSLDNSGQSPLHKAASCNRVKVVEVLLSCGVDKGQRDSAGNTAAKIAAMSGHDKLAELLS